jgi:hypothetical protein
MGGSFRLFNQGSGATLCAVKKVSKVILIAVAAMLVLVIALVFGLNLYIQSPGVQARIQEEISRTLRMPLKITNTSLTPWSDLRITGISIPNGGTNLLEAAAFNARYRIRPLLTGKLVIYDMTVESPKIVWPQNAEGKWELPRPGQAAAKSAAVPPESSANQPPQPPPPVEPAEPKAPHEEKPKKKSGFQVVIEGFEIKHGDVQLLDAAGQKVATFSDVHMLYTTLTPERIEGVADIERVVWSEAFTFEKVRVPFNYSADIVDLPQITATFGGGPVSGSFNLKSSAPKEPFTFAAKFDGVDVTRVAKEAKWGEGQTSGVLAGTVDLHGSFPRFIRAEGTAHLTLANGRFQEFSYFEMIGQALQIKQLSDLRLKESTADVRIADEKMNFDKLTLDASDLQLTAGGLARFDGKLQLNARLSAQDALIKQLPSLVRDNFAAGDNDTRYIDFKITGRADKPKTDLLDKIVGQKLETQFDDLVNSLFGTKRKKEDDKTKEGDAKKDKKKKKKDEDEMKKSEDAKAAAAASARPAETQ